MQDQACPEVAGDRGLTWYRLSESTPSLDLASSIHWPTMETAHTTSVALCAPRPCG